MFATVENASSYKNINVNVKTHGIKTATTLFTKQMFKSQVKVKRYSLTIIFLITGKSVEISQDRSL